MSMTIAELTKPETQSKVHFKAATATETNPHHPDHNEDALLANPDKGYAGVFDGVGGVVHGEKASRVARYAFDEVLKQLSNNPTQEQVEQALTQGYQKAIAAIAEEETKVSEKGMATTGTVAFVYSIGDEVYMTYLQVGDSRGYFEEADDDGTIHLRQFTEDDSYINGVLHMNVHDGSLSEGEAENIKQLLSNAQSKAEIPPEWQWLWNVRNQITKDIDARGKSLPTIKTEKLSPKVKRILLISDGVSDNSRHEEIEEAFRGNNNSTKVINKVISDAEATSKQTSGRAKPDDISGVILEVIRT